MKTFRALALVSVVLLAFVTCLNGCANRDNLLNEKLKEANSHLKRSAKKIEELEGFKGKWEKAVSVEEGPEAASNTIELLEEARAVEEAALAELVKGAEDLEQAASMQSSDNMKEYLRLKLDAVGEQEEALRTELQAMEIRLEITGDIASGADIDQVTIAKLRRVSELENESKGHAEEAAVLDKKAKSYYESSKL